MPNLSPSGGGPHIFGGRLKEALLSRGLRHSEGDRNHLSLINGAPTRGKYNLLRLDGLHFNKSHPENQSIFTAYKNFDHIIFQGEFCRDQYESFTGSSRPHSIIPNGVPSSFFEPTAPAFETDREKALIASSSWRRHKRIEEVIDAFRSPRLRDIELVILGGYPDPDLPNVSALPKFPPHLLPAFYQAADAMVHLAWLDWCPNTVVEGLASGLPVLCSHNGGTKELVKGDGIVIELEEDYTLGTELDLYSPPKVDVNTIIEGILKIIEMPTIKTRNDLKIDNIALQYNAIFQQ